MNDMKRKALAILTKLQEADTPVFLAMIALCCIMGRSDMEAPTGCTRGDFKRAIRALRGIQGIVPHPQEVEDAVLLIRREWLHKQVT